MIQFVDSYENRLIHFVGGINSHGPPWYDEYTGERLPDDEVAEAMQSERNSLHSFKTGRPVNEKERYVPARSSSPVDGFSTGRRARARSRHGWLPNK
eukprot:16045985-Heterocapsa_arctica.AAC.1